MNTHTPYARARDAALRLLSLAFVAITVFAVQGDFASAGDPDQLGGAAGRSGVIFPIGVPSLDGSNNNPQHPDWGQSFTQYTRVAPASYADGIAEMNGGPPARYISNRIFNDTTQNLFSENNASEWAYVWGQFMDHTFGLRDETPGEDATIPFDNADPLEEFRNDLVGIGFNRTPGADGTGFASPREQINTVSSYIDAWAVYGGSNDRLEWLREGPQDGDLSNNSATMLAPGGYLPYTGARGDVSTAPAMDFMGRLQGAPQDAIVAGDVRANENIALTAVQTLFVREHNRIVATLPSGLPEQTKFDIARRIVIAEEQYITYTQFLPSLGVQLPTYRGYDPSVNTSLSNEFAVVGYRAHSMVHGDIEGVGEAADYTPEQIEALEAQGVEVEVDGDEIEFAVPLNVAFGNPGLVEQIGLGAILLGLAGERQYNNDEQIDNQMRSVLFQIPGPDVEDPSLCFDGPTLPACFSGVVDLAALDIQRGRDHGIPNYSQLRAAYGLAPKTSFAQITGEASEDFPSDPEIDAADPINDPDILDFTELRDGNGVIVDPDSEEAGAFSVVGIRRAPLAARLKAIYGDVANVDAFVGMSAEPHLPGTEFGELQLAMWKKQFRALRDGDRYYYKNDPALDEIKKRFGIDYHYSLADIIEANADLPEGELQADVFRAAAPEDEVPEATATSTVVAATPTPWLPGYDNCGDVTGDGRVDRADLEAERNALDRGSTDPRYDISRDGKINIWDALIIRSQLGERCRRGGNNGQPGAATPTPAPSSTPQATATPWLPGYNNCGDVTGDGRVDQSDLDAESKALAGNSTDPPYDVNRDRLVNYWDKLLIWIQLNTRCTR